jgi:hypothetical protein
MQPSKLWENEYLRSTTVLIDLGFLGIFFFFETGPHFVAQAGLELAILLLQPPQC